jgi:hypothetical protein
VLARCPDPGLCRARLPRQQVLRVGAAAATPSFASCSPDWASRRRSVQFLFGYRFRRLSISYSPWSSRRLFLSELAQGPLYPLGCVLPRSPRSVVVDLAACCCGTWIVLASTRTSRTVIIFVEWKSSRWPVDVVDRHPRLRQVPSREDALVLATCHQLEKRNLMGIWSRIEIVCIARQTCVIKDVNRKPSSCFRLSRRISQGKQICYSF